jgi:hypothetical protein
MRNYTLLFVIISFYFHPAPKTLMTVSSAAGSLKMPGNKNYLTVIIFRPAMKTAFSLFQRMAMPPI